MYSMLNDIKLASHRIEPLTTVTDAWTMLLDKSILNDHLMMDSYYFINK